MEEPKFLQKFTDIEELVLEVAREVGYFKFNSKVSELDLAIILDMTTIEVRTVLKAIFSTMDHNHRVMGDVN